VTFDALYQLISSIDGEDFAASAYNRLRDERSADATFWLELARWWRRMFEDELQLYGVESDPELFGRCK